MRFQGRTLATVLAVVWGISAQKATAQETFIYNFGAGGPYDARSPVTGLLRDAQGNLFGVTSGGGPTNTGTIFEVSPVAGGGWTEKVLVGDVPSTNISRLVSDDHGNLYGSAPYSGSHNMSGIVYEVSPNPNGSWTYKVLYNFGTSANDGSFPLGSLIFDAQGNLYGTTYHTYTDSLGYTFGDGTVFELSPQQAAVGPSRCCTPLAQLARTDLTRVRV